MDQFTPAELFEMFYLARSSMDAQFEFWISITFAVVVAAFVAGRRLSQRLRFIICTLYLLATIVLVLNFVVDGATAGGMVAALVDRGSTVVPRMVLPTLMIASRYTVFLVGTVAAVYVLLRPPESGASPHVPGD